MSAPTSLASYKTHNNDGESIFRKIGATTYQGAAQPFTSSQGSSYVVTYMMAELRKTGAPTERLRFRIFTDSAGSPGVSLGGTTMTGSSVATGSYAEYAAGIPSATITIATATTYWYVIDTAVDGTDDTNYYQWGMANSSIPYTAHKYKTNGTFTTETGYNVYFEIKGLAAGGGASPLKTVNGLANASVKTINGLANASVKTYNGLSNQGSVTYASWNGSDKTADVTLSGSDLVATDTSDAWGGVRGNMGISAGKWYWEVTITAEGTNGGNFIGVGTTGAFTGPLFFSGTGNAWGMLDNGNKRAQGTDTNVTTSYGVGTVLGVAIDMDAGELSMYKNGTLLGGGALFTGITGTVYPIWNDFYNTNAISANFGGSAFAHSVPSGYNAGLYV